MLLKEDIKHVRFVVDENLELTDDVLEDIEESRNRGESEFISNEDMRKEFG